MKKRCVPLALGGILLFFFLAAAVFPAAFTSYGQKEMFAPWLTPSPAHLLGTNALGYDIFTELVYGTRQTLLIGVSSSVLTLVLGSVIGTLAAGKSVVGGVLNGVINIFVLLPKLVTMIVLATFLGSSSRNLILLIAAFSWVGTARNVRAKVIHLNAQPFIENCVIQAYCSAPHYSQPVRRAALPFPFGGQQLYHDGVYAELSRLWRPLLSHLGHDDQLCLQAGRFSPAGI